MESNIVQINALKFNPDIDGLLAPQQQSSNAVIVSVQGLLHSPQSSTADAIQVQQDNPHQDQREPEYQHPQDSCGIDDITRQILYYPGDTQSTEHIQNPTATNSQFSEIPELEEDWDNGQFADADDQLINRHNTHSESERIRKEYSQHLLDLSDNEYYLGDTSINQLQYHCPDPDYYGPPPRRSNREPRDPNSYYPPPPDPADIQHWYTTGRGKHALLHGVRSNLTIHLSVPPLLYCSQ